MKMVTTESELEDILTVPGEADIEFMRRLDGDLLILGAGGKMGPSLAKLAGRAREAAGASGRVIAVSRFSSPEERESIAAAGVETIVADLLDREAVGRLPEAENVIFLAGRKFGSADRPDLTWAINTIVPANVAMRYSRSRIVVFSTGNVYPFVSKRSGRSGGSVESDTPDPSGEYAQSCLGRERVFEYFSREAGLRALLFRLNYATDLRYGILPEIARKIFTEQAVNLTVGHFNIIWQGDANSYGLRALDLCQSPARVLNVTGPEIVSVRESALYFGRRFGKQVRFEGEDRDLALLNRADECHRLLGSPLVRLGELQEMVATWVENGGRSLAKPTRFEVTDGRF